MKRHRRSKMEISISMVLMALLLAFTMLISKGEGQLSENFYSSSCPNVEAIVSQAVTNKFTQTITTGQATLRLFFHDCFVEVPFQFIYFISSSLVLISNIVFQCQFFYKEKNILSPLFIKWFSLFFIRFARFPPKSMKMRAISFCNYYLFWNFILEDALLKYDRDLYGWWRLILHFCHFASRIWMNDFFFVYS